MIFVYIKSIIQNGELLNQFIKFQSALILLVTLYVALVLKTRIYLAKKYNDLDVKYSDSLIDELFFDTRPEEDNIKMPPWWQIFQRKSLQNTLITHMSKMSGGELEHVVRIYHELGFAKIDATNTYSFSWDVRLTAVTNLNYLKHPDYAPFLHRLLNDQNEFVAASALLALTATKHELNEPSLFSMYGPRFSARTNILVEVALNIANIHGIDVLYRKVNKNISQSLKDSCVAAIIASKDLNRSSVMLDLLDVHGLSAWSVRSVLEALNSLGDPDHKLVIEKFLTHPNSGIRLEAKKWFDTMGLETAEVAA